MKRLTDPAITELMKRPLSDSARGFLREVKFQRGKLELYTPVRRRLAEECRRCGDGETAKMTGLGQAYLDRLMREH